MSIPSPKERPDLYDGYDCDERKPMSREAVEAVMPDHVKKAIAKRQAKKGSPPARAAE